MRRAHAMPFGAEPSAAGAVRFRLWAPAAQRVDLCLENGPEQETRLPMTRLHEGWFERDEPGAAPGARYRFQIDGEIRVPDPASRFQPDGVHGASEVIDPCAFHWSDGDWRGRPWHEAAIYELHVGAFSPQGGFAGVEQRLDYLVELGVTAIELMPVAAFPGDRGWGYDGVAPFAPFRAYGRPEALKALVASAHARGLMVLLDVVYNHFGPEGCYLHAYAPQFFTHRHETPWGAAIDLDGDDTEVVRRFFIHNALYWLEEFHLDGLRLDAVHALHDEGEPHLLQALAEAVDQGPGSQRAIHLVLENDRNEASRLAGGEHRRGRYRAQWNDDLHHAMHVLVTGETDGYYEEFAHRPVHRLGRCLAEGFDYQGEPSAHRAGTLRGEPSAHLPPSAFVAFLQNHDQVGNRAMGERITALASAQAVRAANTIILIAPQIPLLFMGEEFAAAQSFPFFCDFGPDLARAVTEGRRQEFARFSRFADEAAREAIPDPNDPATFRSACLDWDQLRSPAHQQWLAHVRKLLALRRRVVVPRLGPASVRGAGFMVSDEGVLRVQWTLAGASTLVVLARPGDHTASLAGVPLPAVPPFCVSAEDLATQIAAGRLPGWSVAWFLEAASAGDTP